MSHLYFMSSSEIIFPEVKHRRLEPNIRKKIKLFFWNGIEILYNVFERKDSTIPFSAFLDDLRYAWATIVALCSQGLNACLWAYITQKLQILSFLSSFFINIFKYLKIEGLNKQLSYWNWLLTLPYICVFSLVKTISWIHQKNL
jgi:hypothetical protein